MRAVNSLLIIAILLFATAMTWTYFAVRGDQPRTIPQAGIGGGPNDTTNTNYKTQFSTLLAEHGNVAATHLTSMYDGNATADTAKRLNDNSQKLADQIQTLGTTTDRDAFLKTFTGHIVEYERYTQGAKQNEQAVKNVAKENLQMHAMEFGELTHKLMPSISTQRGTELMNEHVNLTLAIVDAHAKGDTVAKLSAMKDANAQALKFADELAQGASLTKSH